MDTTDNVIAATSWDYLNYKAKIKAVAYGKFNGGLGMTDEEIKELVDMITVDYFKPISMKELNRLGTPTKVVSRAKHFRKD